jgi:hypothetical protein
VHKQRILHLLTGSKNPNSIHKMLSAPKAANIPNNTHNAIAIPPVYSMFPGMVWLPHSVLYFLRKEKTFRKFFFTGTQKSPGPKTGAFDRL